jgi:hypothetical protein
MKFFSNLWSNTPINGSFLDDAEYIHRSRWSQKFSEAARADFRPFDSLRFRRHFLQPLRKSLPISARAQALQDVYLIGIRAD